MSATLSRRELVLSGAAAYAALAVPVDALAAVRTRRPRKSVHCLPPEDKFKPGEVIPDCTFASFSPGGERIALATPRGIEILGRADGSRVTVTPPGFTLAPNAWHPDGTVLLASGPASDGSGPFLHALTTGGPVRLLPGHPGQARAASFSPDGRKVAFTYLNGFVHQLAMADWTGTELVNPLNLLPVDPQTEPILDRVMSSLAWYETRGFSPNGRRLYFASDRGAGMLNVSLHYIDLARGKRSRVTYDEGVVEGAVIAPDNDVLYAVTTRAREPAFITVASGPSIPPFLGCVAHHALHERLAARRLAVVGNGDVIAMDSTYGLHGRMVANRRKLARRLEAPVPGAAHRFYACGMSPDGTELAIATHSVAGSNVVLVRRRPRSVPAPARVRATPSSRGAIPLTASPLRPVNRTMPSERGGQVTLNLEGEVTSGDFQMELGNFSADGVHVFSGTARFQTDGGAFRHTADVRRVNLESQEEVNVFYSADMRVDWPAGTPAVPVTDGTIASRSRAGNVAAAWDGSTFAPQDGWRAGGRAALPIPGARRCRRRRT